MRPKTGMNPHDIAIRYYFGEFQYWKLPRVAVDALKQGYDGPALRKLAGLNNPTACEMDPAEIDSAFREMGVDAPIPKDFARLVLAVESASRAVNEPSNVFDEATHIRIHLCGLESPPDELSRIVTLSEMARKTPRWKWSRLERELKEAFLEFLANYHSSRVLPGSR